MRSRYAVPCPPVHPGRPRATRPALATATALACVLAQLSTALCEAGTVVRGRLHVPASVPATTAQGEALSEAPDVRDAVIYVTQPEFPRGKKLNRKGVRGQVRLAGDLFMPQVLSVVVGSRVRFENSDRVYHNVFSVSPARRFDLGKLAPGASAEVRFDSAGVVQLFCELHPASAGFVVVCPNRIYARPTTSGEYTLPSLPRGPYIVHVWHPRLGATRRAIDVSGHGDLTLDLRL